MSFDVFNSDAFSLVEMTAAINKQPYTPGLIGSLGIFESGGVSTTSVQIEETAGKLALVSNQPRSGPKATVLGRDRRVMRNFVVPHLPHTFSVMAEEVQNVRAFGSETALSTIEALRDSKLAEARRNLDYTLENLRLGAIRGIVLDADGSTTIHNLYTEFGVTQATEIDFDLDNASPASGAVQNKCKQVVRQMLAALDNASPATVVALCGDTFFDQLTAHIEVRQPYAIQQQAPFKGFGIDLSGFAYDSVYYSGILFINYRGTTAVTIAAGEAKFFPVGVRGLFLTRYAPANYIETVNTIGLPMYAKTEMMDFGKGIECEAQSNPLNLCTRPLALQRARNT